MITRVKTLWVVMLIIAFQMLLSILTAETIFYESMGAATTITEIPAYTGWSSNGSVYCSGTADVRSTYNSAGDYPGASGAGNIYFVGGMNEYFQISGINTRGYDNIRLSLSLHKANSNTTTGNAENGSNFQIRYSVDNGQSWRPIPITIPTGANTTDIYYKRDLTENLPATDNLTLCFTNIGATEPVHFRMDDVTITGNTRSLFNETMGAGATNTAIESFPDWTCNDLGVFSGTGLVSNDLPSTGKYPGASGGGNILLGAGQYFQVSGLYITAHNMIALSVGVMKSAAAETGAGLLMSYTIDGTSWSSPQPCLTYGLTANLWYKKSFSLLPGIYTNVGIKFSNTSTNGGSFRIDDLCLKTAWNTPEIGFPTCVELSSTMATLRASIVSFNCSNVIQRGFFYSTQNGFTDGDGTLLYESVSMTQPADYSFSVSGLQANTTYYFKAFAANSLGTSYSGQQSFTTLASGVLPATLTVNPNGMGINNYGSLQEVVNTLNAGTLGTDGITIKVAAGITEQITTPIIISATGTSTKPIQIIKDPSISGANPLIKRIDSGLIATSVEGGLGDCLIRIEGSDYLTIDGIDLSADNSGIEYGYLANKPNATNGCQNLTIKNCTITMNKGNNPYVAGVYIGNGTNSVSDAAGVTVTAASGKNMTVTLTGNTISNVYTGILMRGSSANSYWDSDYIIGSSGAGNQILNFGGNTSTHSQGIFFVNVKNPTVAYNIIDNTGAGGTPHSEELSGVYFLSVSGAVNANNNSIKLACDTQEALVNVTWIKNPSTSTSESYVNNTFSAGTLSNVDACTLIAARNQTLTRTVTGNITSGTFSLMGNTTACYGYVGITDATPNVVHTISNNNFSNFTAQNSTDITGIHSYLFGDTTNLQISGNTVSNLSSPGGEMAGIAVNSTGTCSISNNTISNLSGPGWTYGIRYYGKTINVYNNTVSNVVNSSTTEGLAIRGIHQEFATTANCYNNTIYGLSSARQDFYVAGIEVEDGTTTKIYNNMIHGIYAAGSMWTAAVGIFIKEGVSTEVSYNSVYLDGIGSSVQYSSAALNLWGSTSTIRNNIFVNKSTPGSYGKVTAIEKGSNGSLDLGSSTNKNIYYAGIPDSQHLIAILGTNSYPTLAGYKTAVSTVDQGSFTQDVPFISTTGTYNLHMNPFIPTYAQNQASPLSGITTDIDGQTRGTSTPDIGADEGAFTAAPTCVAPSTQAVALSLIPGNTSIRGTITPSSAPAYLVLLHTASTASAAPVNGIDYSLGASLGNATVVSIGSATTFSVTGLSIQTQYYFTVYAYNSFGIGAPMYRTTAPISQGIMTLPTPPEDPVDFAPYAASHTSIEFTAIANTAGSNIMIAWSLNQTFGTPIGMYNAGSPITGGGTVLYMGSATSIPNHTGLSLGTTYYYKVWSYETIERVAYGSFSPGITASAKTPGSPLLGVKTVNPLGSGENNYLSLSQAIADLNDSWTGPGGVIINVVAGYTETVTAPLTITATGFADSPITIQKDPATTGANPLIIRNDAGIYGANWVDKIGDSIIRIEGSDYITFDGIDISSVNSGIDFGYYAHRPSGINGCQYLTIKNCTVTMTKLPGLSSMGNVAGILIGNGARPFISIFMPEVTVTAPSGINRNISITGNTIKNINYGILSLGSQLEGFHDRDFMIGTESSPNIILDFYGSDTGGIELRYLDNASICYNAIDNTGGGGIVNAGNLRGIELRSICGELEVNHNNITMAVSGLNTKVAWIDLFYCNTTNENLIGNIFAGGLLDFTNDSALINAYSVSQMRTVSGNLTNGVIHSLGSSGNLYGYRTYFERKSTSELIANNNFSNLAVSGTSNLYGVFAAGTPQTSSYTGNILQNLSAYSGMVIGIQIWGDSEVLVTHNTISNLVSGGSIYGIKASGFPANVSHNLVYYCLATDPAATVRGISASEYNSRVYNNMVHSLFGHGTDTISSIPTVAGIEVLDGSSVYHNSVLLIESGFSTGSGYSTAAVYCTTYNSICRNNIFVNKSNHGNAGRSAARWGDSPSILYGNNNNIYYAGTPGPRNLIAYLGGNSVQTFADYRQNLGLQENMSLTEDVPFMVTFESVDLHINPEIPTFAESGGALIEGYATDFDGDTRNTTSPDIGADEGDFIRDGVPPLPATSPSPADLTTDQLTDVQLSWSLGTGGTIPSSYNVYFGTSNPPSLIGNQTTTTYNPGTLGYNQTYYWKIDPSNSYGLASSLNTLPVWSFTTHNPLPETAVLVSPASGATDIAINPSLAWSAGTGFTPTGYKLYLGTDNPPTNVINGIDLGNVTDFTPGEGRHDHAPVTLSGSLSKPERDAILSRSTLNYNSTYYWKIIPYTAAGEAINNPVWSFTTELAPVPNVAINPLPVNLATGQSIISVLSWDANTEGTLPDSYNVYFGTSNPPVLIGDQTTTTFDPGTLAYNTTYYWKIDPHSQRGYTSLNNTLPVWSFTTENSLYPSQVVLISPNDGSSGSNTAVSLNWAAGAGAPPTGYKIYLGTDNPPTNILNGMDLGNVTTCNPAGLISSTTYYWKVLAYNNLGDAPSAVIWSFSTSLPEVSIGTGTGTNRSPFGTNYGYERDATLYKAAEIGNLAQPIRSLGWYATRSVSTGTPVKIYLKATTETALPAVNWASTISGATLVYNGTIGSINANAWMSVNLSPAFNLPSGNNLMVLIETNYGGSGNGNFNGGGFLNTNYSPVNTLHKYWMANTTPPTTTGSFDILRANIRISGFTTTVSLPNPAVATAPLNGATTVPLNASLNWSSGGGTVNGYRLYLGTDGNGTSTPSNLVYGLDLGNTLSYIPSVSLNYNTTYYWKVIPYNNTGTASGSSIWSFNTESEPVLNLDAPSNLEITMIGEVIILSWDTVANAVSYQIYCSSDPNTADWGMPIGYTDQTVFMESTTQSKYFYRVVASSDSPVKGVSTSVSHPITKPDIIIRK